MCVNYVLHDTLFLLKIYFVQFNPIQRGQGYNYFMFVDLFLGIGYGVSSLEI
jgi:hypothetical protein